MTVHAKINDMSAKLISSYRDYYAVRINFAEI